MASSPDVPSRPEAGSRMRPAPRRYAFPAGRSANHVPAGTLSAGSRASLRSLSPGGQRGSGRRRVPFRSLCRGCWHMLRPLILRMGAILELDVRGHRVALERHEVEWLAGLAQAQAARSSRARDLAVLLAGPRRSVVLQRADERTLARLLGDHDQLSHGLTALRDAVTTS